MKRINILDTVTSNKIAAGEVVERPSSVAKELIENSLDASSKKITIEIEEGGEKLLKIIDDGHGIHPDDIEKAFTTHGTSKISSLEDIYKINTLGFRGEALPSIASVSEVTLSSRSIDFDYGKEISYGGGNLNYVKEIGKSIGTTVEVKNLFFNVPARQKFLKTPKHEGSLISDYVMRLALSNSDVSFKLFKDGKKSVESFGGGNLKDTIRALYGKQVYENVIEFENHNDVASVYGYIGNADISKGSRNYQSIFVNKRYIKNRMISTAVENAFKSFLTVNKFPFFVLFIDIFPELVDVNIHPTKSEIKFSDDRLIFKLVFDAVHKALRKNLEDSFLSDESISFNNSELTLNKDRLQSLHQEINTLEDSGKTISVPIDLKSDKEERYVADIYKPASEFKYTSPSEDKSYFGVEEKAEVSKPFNAPQSFFTYDTNIKEKVVSEDLLEKDDLVKSESTRNLERVHDIQEEVDEGIVPIKEEVIKMPKFGKPRIIGQFNKTYIIAELNSELYLIDQHAAHEKILFEKYSRDIDNGKVVSQMLFTSVIIELSFEDYAIYSDNEEVFKKVGFTIENFGEDTINIREIPIILKGTSPEKIFFEILENLKNMGSAKNSEVKFERVSKLACRSAVKANDVLSLSEMDHLIEELRYIEAPFTCPHGRPTIIKYSLYEIEKMFKRIQ